MDPPDGCPDNMYDIMCHCWEMEPHERPDFVRLRELLTRSFGKGMCMCSVEMAAGFLVGVALGGV